MEFLQHQLKNGIRIIHKPTINSPVAHCGIMINAGSRDELPGEEGLAHFIEHCLFKGTTRRRAFHILSRMDSVGAEINAYTTKEETAIYSSFLVPHFERAIEFISDITFNSTFPEKEIKKEKDVIIDEINSYMDSPSELIFDQFEEYIFDGHPIGKSILGTIESVKNLSRQNIIDFISRQYCADQIVLSTVGNLDFKKVIRLAEKYLGHIPASRLQQPRQPIVKYNPVHKITEMKTYQAHYTIGGRAYPVDHQKKTGLILLNNFLGGPAMNSKLNMNIREKYGIAYNIESNYQPYTDTGIFEIYLGTDAAMLNKTKKLILKELKNLKTTRLSTMMLHRAKEQIKGQIALGQEGGSNMMLALGKSILLYDKVDSTQEVFEKIDKIESSELLEIANEIFDESKLSSLTFK